MSIADLGRLILELQHAERELDPVVRDHSWDGLFCGCVLCEAWRAVIGALNSMERPGYDMFRYEKRPPFLENR